MNVMLCPSMMCADFGNLDNEIKRLELAGADILHLDVMDWDNMYQILGWGFRT